MTPDELEDLIGAIRRRRTQGSSDERIRSDLGSGQRPYASEDLDRAFAALRIRAARGWWPGEDTAEGGGILGEAPRADEWYQPPSGDPAESPRWTAIQLGLRARFGEDSSIERSVDVTSTRIVSLLADPRSASFSRRGLVLGYVQSGKTTSFTAVAAKAADAGYKLVVVLSGIAENLRIQTQERLDTDLTLGKDERIAPYWNRLTHPGERVTRADGSSRLLIGDFPSQLASTPEQALASRTTSSYAVVKKNVSRLRNLHKFLSQNPELVARTPILVIDDEADQASIDISDAEDAAKRSRINEWILRILSVGRVSYLGYTATPFANLFVDPRFQEGAGTFDIYPRDFIYALPEPDAGYFGTRRLFGATADPEAAPDEADAGADVIRRVADDESNQVRTEARIPDAAPAALAEAVRYFLLATACRRVRGHSDQHSTMLVHSSLRTAVHRGLLRPIDNELETVRRRLADGDEALMRELAVLWSREVGRFNPDNRREFEPFELLAQALPDVLNEVRVVEENSYSRSRLAYSEDGGDVVIVVGGNTLSRGLTLEGLVVSYFVRASTAYDVLLQMGRWFGYRPDYGDLPRVWMTEELESYFEHLARVELELRAEVERYERDPEMTPLALGPRIRAHPKMMVTARAKMQRAVLQRSDFGERVHQTTHFNLDDSAALSATLLRTSNFLDRSRDAAGDRHDLAGPAVVFHDVPRGIVSGYLADYPWHPDESWAEGGFLDYVRAEEEEGMAWNVAVLGSTTDDFDMIPVGGGIEVRPWNRSRYEGPRSTADIGVLRNAGHDEIIDLTLDPSAPNQKAPQRIALRLAHPRFSRHALLVVYPVARNSKFSERGRRNSRKERVDLGSEVDLIGLMCVFPRTRNPGAGVHYELDPDLLRLADSGEDVDVDSDADDVA